MKKNLIYFFAFFLISYVFAFEWPQEDGAVSPESLVSYFGQERGGLISASVIFSEPSQVKAAEQGQIIAIITENYDDSDFFPSALGTAVIISHQDNLQSVYANLDANTLTFNGVGKNETSVDSGEILGKTRNSSWQSVKGGLEFQIIDAKTESAVNPKVLMPRSEKELPLNILGVRLEDKNRVFYDVGDYKILQSGLYKIYYKKNSVAVPYKTSVFVNGVIADQIRYDNIIQENNKICVSGKKKYASEDVYAADGLHLLGEAALTSGKITLKLFAEDILGNSKEATLNIAVK